MISKHYLSVIIPHAAGSRLLMLSGKQGWGLPFFQIVDRADTCLAAYLNRELKSRLGIGVTVLRLFDPGLVTRTGAVHTVFLMENQSPNWNPPAGGAWVGRDELGGLRFSIAGLRATLEGWFDEAEGRVPPGDVSPWARPGWLASAAAWIRSRLDRRGLTALGPVEQLNSSVNSCILRVATESGLVYLKALRDDYAHEPALISDLSVEYPAHLPEVLAVDRERHWILMRDAGGNSLYRTSDRSCWERAVQTYARIQLEYAGREARLLALGCADWRVGRLEQDLDELCDLAAAFSKDSPERLTMAEVDELKLRSEEMRTICRRLGDYRIPATIEHGDLHPLNIFIAEGRCVYLDWTYSSLAHPFLSLKEIFLGIKLWRPDLRSAKLRLRDAYLEPWTTCEPKDRLIEAYRLMPALATLRGAVCAYRQFPGRRIKEWNDGSEFVAQVRYFIQSAPLAIARATDSFRSL